MSKAAMPNRLNDVFTILYLLTMVIIYIKPITEDNNSSEIDYSKDYVRRVTLLL
jgi:hypothetical protein